MSVARMVVRRALLYVPGSSQKMLEKSRGLKADCVTYDLEDSVTPNKKADARFNIRSFLEQPRADGIKENAVRINAVGTGHEADDIEAVCNAPYLDTIVVPKVNSSSDLKWVTDFINGKRTFIEAKETAPRPIKILALIESAKAITNLREICQTTPQLEGLIFAAEDFALDLSLTRTPSLTEFLYARSAIATACRAHELPSTIDLVCTSFKGEDGRRVMEEECLGGKSLGFNGKQCIHPDQVAIAQKAFAPSDDEVTWAIRILTADAKAAERGRGAWTLDGKMIDAPVVGNAKSLASKAEACGFAVSATKEKWRNQEPE